MAGWTRDIQCWGLMMDKILTLLRVFLGGLFLYASWDKILHPESFANLVSGYRLVPPELVTLVALVLPWLELLCGLCLILGYLTRSSAIWVTLMSCAFLIAKVTAVWRGLDISCGCLSVDGNSSLTWWNIPPNLGLLVLCWVSARQGAGAWSLDAYWQLDKESQF